MEFVKMAMAFGTAGGVALLFSGRLEQMLKLTIRQKRR
jgi:hypothetical protein